VAAARAAAAAAWAAAAAARATGARGPVSALEAAGHAAKAASEALAAGLSPQPGGRAKARRARKRAGAASGALGCGSEDCSSHSSSAEASSRTSQPASPPEEQQTEGLPECATPPGQPLLGASRRARPRRGQPESATPPEQPLQESATPPEQPRPAAPLEQPPAERVTPLEELPTEGQPESATPPEQPLLGASRRARPRRGQPESATPPEQTECDEHRWDDFLDFMEQAQQCAQHGRSVPAGAQHGCKAATAAATSVSALSTGATRSDAAWPGDSAQMAAAARANPMSALANRGARKAIDIYSSKLDPQRIESLQVPLHQSAQRYGLQTICEAILAVPQFRGAEQPEGVSLASICDHVDFVPAGVVRTAMESLVADGLAYHTIDERHFCAVDSAGLD